MIEVYDEGRPQWSQQEAVAFEAAQELLNKANAVFQRDIYTEMQKSAPDEEGLARTAREVERVKQLKDELDPTDRETVAKVRAEYRLLWKELQKP